MIKKTLGGDRVGSGNRMQEYMHNFKRSNKNLSVTAGTTMQPGILYPLYTNIALKGDTFDMDLNAFVRTIPTKGPLYGSFKLQCDVYQVPFRLYQAILHNNTTDIARKMNQVYLPKIRLEAKLKPIEYQEGFKTQINESSLMRYLNMSGLGKCSSSDSLNQTIHRDVLAIPMLAYYDIFKNYYANKQEEMAYVITPNEEAMMLNNIAFYNKAGELLSDNNFSSNQANIAETQFIGQKIYYTIFISGQNLDLEQIRITSNNFSGTLKELSKEKLKIVLSEDKKSISITPKGISNGFNLGDFSIIGERFSDGGITLTPFELSNIDDMRKYLLTQWDLGTKVVISNNNQKYLPYSTLTTNTASGRSKNIYPLNGLVVKCYQSDMFNNWLDTDWVNEITNTSAIDTTNGSFTLDTLAFKKKLYDHLNRLAIAGGTYDDWQEATYGDKVWGKSEKPIYCGGMSSEVVFDEVVSTAATADDPLGTIGGRGTLNTRKGGKVTIKVGEASVIMVIVSLTPRLFYTQGNAWYNTELDTMDDLHKPIFDRIGFQDLIVEQMAWWDTTIAQTSIDETTFEQVPGLIVSRSSAGKQPAWMQYATDIDRAYGDFAKSEGASFMILSRDYQQSEDGAGDVQDVTTYIDPRKYNYAFAYSALDAQNFWTFLKMNIKARRKMSNTQIPMV